MTDAPRVSPLQEYSQKIGDDKRLQEHLKLPIQRLNDYQLLLRVSNVMYVVCGNGVLYVLERYQESRWLKLECVWRERMVREFSKEAL